MSYYYRLSNRGSKINRGIKLIIWQVKYQTKYNIYIWIHESGENKTEVIWSQIRIVLVITKFVASTSEPTEKT